MRKIAGGSKPACESGLLLEAMLRMLPGNAAAAERPWLLLEAMLRMLPGNAAAAERPWIIIDVNAEHDMRLGLSARYSAAMHTISVVASPEAF